MIGPGNQNDVDEYKKTDFIYKKLVEERKLNSELREKISHLEAQVSSLQASLSGLRESTTYKVGLAISNSRSLRSFIDLPIELYKIFRSYKKKTKTLKNHVKENELAVANANVVTDNRKDSDKIWIVPANFSKFDNNYNFEVQGSGSSVLHAEIPVISATRIVLVTNKITEWGLRHLASDISIVIEQMSGEGACIWTKTLKAPVCEMYDDGALDEHSLAFSLITKDTAEYVSITLYDELGLCINLIDSLNVMSLASGVSVVVPTYKGEEHLGECLTSLARQTLSKDRFEIIIIINGEPGGIEKVINSFQKNYPDVDCRTIKEQVASASLARNIGIYNASKDHITFVDDDDQLSEVFLEEMYRFAASDPNHPVALSSIRDISDNTILENSISYQVDRAIKKSKLSYTDVTSLLTMNACKLFPTFYIKQLRYELSMKSGEDVCFFTRYFIKYSPELSLVPASKGAIYYRTLRQGSVSRKASSFDFNVKQRIDVINSINSSALLLTDRSKIEFAASKINAQSEFVLRYVSDNVECYSEYVDLLESKKYIVPFYERIASQLSTTLIYSYCFIPYVDTAAVVMAKRIRELAIPVDVIFNNMSKVRAKNVRLEEIAKGFVGEKVEINSPASFSNWKSIEKFVTLANREAMALCKKRGAGYSTIYSRVMWPGSHFAALLHKIKDKDTKWTAEFSDPVLKDIHGNNREASIDPKWLENNHVIAKVFEKGFTVPSTTNLFFWCEYIAFIFADELIFTNMNQLTYMVSYVDDDDIKALIYAKSVILPHPTLPESYYSLSSPDYQIDEEKVNFAYFGNFYATRGMSYIFQAIASLPNDLKSKCQLHIFTNSTDDLINQIKSYGLSDEVVINDYVDYLDFLALSNKMDCLIVNDALTEGVKIVNPYLPSKYSDYLGASAKIWGICERDSVLRFKLSDDNTGRTLISYIGDYDSIYNALTETMLSKSSEVL
ncbi:glycosyltransferase [Vreelandella andesensis]|uniref:Glycosyltransferase n=1 Tax=Vreelandella andesensis TaxID=447567 RepID=A0A433KGI0_9GAMM|nr:glycosyltransferase [Halomonas andesensis]RUR27816.1 glycosyltransferase [Halomonas andesensis]